MAKPNYAFAKRQRDLAKKKKKEDKQQRKSAGDAADTADTTERPPAADNSGSAAG